MSKGFQPTAHPVLGLPTAGQARALGEKAWIETLAKREEIIRQEKNDPFRHTWEPPIWWVVDCIMGFPWVPEEEADALRRVLGFEKPAPVCLAIGGNRAGKSQWASNRTMRVLRVVRRPWACKGWALHSTMPMSVQYQQPLFWHWMPQELKGKATREGSTYVAYKQKTGFAEQSFVLPPSRTGEPGPDCLFKTYDQDMGSIEGGNLDIIWPDELVPPDWIETMELRLAEKNGWMPTTFTPVQGYSETVRLFADGAQTVMESVAFLSPKDGGPPDVARALGFQPLADGTTPEDQLAELRKADRERRAAVYPQSIPERCREWLKQAKAWTPNSAPLLSNGQPAIPEGLSGSGLREFERVPRVMKCADPEGKRAIVFFHSADNPYGNPKNVYATIASKSQEFIKERFYGLAHKTLSARFPRFNRNVHVVPAEQVPREGTNHHFVDPCGGRNFFMGWFRVTDQQVYLYREWPSGYYIPGLGVPGPWALPDGRKPDGKLGPAQKSFGWGLRTYKKELARLEGWRDYKEDSGQTPNAKRQTPNEEGAAHEVDEWDPENGCRERVEERFLDSRFASTPRVEKDRPVTLLTEFEEIGLFFTPTPGDDIDEGVIQITNALDYDESRPLSFLNRPKLLISAACPNTIYALQTWTGLTREGRRCLDGATKDPIDLLRYFFLSECGYYGGRTEPEEAEEESDFEEGPKSYY